MIKEFIKEAILKIGEVVGIDGRKIFIRIDKNKNSSDLLFDGDILKNVSVGSYAEIRKGFLSIIGKVEGERLEEEKYQYKNDDNNYEYIDKNKRILTISLFGFIDLNSRFIGGIKELPLIGNEAYLLTKDKIQIIHSLVSSTNDYSISIADTDLEGIPVNFPIDKLFNTHIAIFGNTGSGKSNTLTALYTALFNLFNKKKYKNKFLENSKFLLFDFNGEYSDANCITEVKNVYNLSTDKISQNKIPMSFDELMDIETLSILLEATEKTQKPFLKRTLEYLKKFFPKNSDVSGRSLDIEHLKNTLQKRIFDTLRMSNKEIAYRILDYLIEIFFLFSPQHDPEDDLLSDIEFHGGEVKCFKIRKSKIFFNSDPEKIKKRKIYAAFETLSDDQIRKVSQSELNLFYIFLLFQLTYDLFQNKVQNDHIYPVINRFKAKQREIEKLFTLITTDKLDLWANNNLVVINLHDVNLDMKKTLPLLLAKTVYKKHKSKSNGEILTIIIDEAHNILSKASFRETEEWKDYRLETFEEIIKEGRKFGVFVTIASQRPHDISDTITSQAHNYFIHKLVNERDLQAIGNAVSYIDKITEESIPILPVGTCIFSGTATSMPLKLHIRELPDDKKPKSMTIKFKDILKNN